MEQKTALHYHLNISAPKLTQDLYRVGVVPCPEMIIITLTPRSDDDGNAKNMAEYRDILGRVSAVGCLSHCCRGALVEGVTTLIYSRR